MLYVMYCLKLEMAYMCIYKHCTATMGATVTDNSGYTHTGKGCLIGVQEHDYQTFSLTAGGFGYII